MCGIIGQLGGKIDKPVFESARDVLEHRGPNYAGVFYDKDAPLALGNRRLSIIDLSQAGHMPMESNDRRYVISFNGEVFNYIELRLELEGSYEFRTKTDTEVLLAGFIKWGPDVLSKLIGQFAFAIWDAKDKKLFLARDHFGIKPLFYSKEDDQFIFASEIKALLALGVKAEPNDGIIFDYLAYEIYEHTNATFFKNIFSMPAGHYAFVSESSFEVKPYWSLAEEVKKENPPRSEKEALEKFRGLLEDAIRLQLRSDVPVGITLSSGIDSSTMLHFVRKLLGTKVHAFSSCLKDDVYNECKYIEPWVSKDKGVIWHTGTMEPGMVWNLARELAAAEDQPYGGMHTMQYFNMYRQTHDSPVTVLLEGQGMDEILAGYGYFAPEKRKKFIESFINPQIKRPYLTSDFEEKMKKERRLEIAQPFSDDLRNAQYIDIRYRKLPRPLRFNDHISMAFSKELRVPYLDPRLVTWCVSLPEEYKINNGVQKYLLRALIKEQIPHAMREKDYVEFPAFQTEWFRKYFKEEVIDIINSSSFRSRPYWDHDKVVETVNKFFVGEGNNSFFLWQLVDLEFWFRRFID